MTDNPILRPIAELEVEYERLKAELRTCIEAWHSLPDRFFWQRGDKEAQRRYCCQLLEELRKLAPDAEEVRDRETELGGCSGINSGGQA